ncbi:MAG: asparagine synthase (glutamine-hydrolyzing) [Acidobacteriia bacterium]|nr:asparagine synthase (glutamine-hydrolyzing) [Terriglobia bacterium]
MCGIAGIAGRPGIDRERGETVRRMTATLVHRGPDGEGSAARDGCDLGFRRLAIVDLAATSPPFPNEDGSIWTICNGEIYNGDELRAGLEGRGHRFRTRVDTEVLPHLYEERGPDCVDLLDGMFAFAIWDDRAGRLVLARDRAGEKPLFYWRGPDGLAFASEIRALLAHPRVPRDVDPVALSRFLLHDYFPAPLTPLARVRKLPAGHRLVLERGESRIECYWDLATRSGGSREKPPRLAAAASEVDRLLAQAVARRKRSDVPVGVFLSGGIDSSAVLSHLAEQNGPGVPAFVLGHADPAFDEARYARATAAAFGAELHELILGEDDLAEGLRRVGEGFDEPLGDASTLPTLLLSLFARRRVKVVLSGEGADELFAGYPTYLGNRVAEALRRVPGPMRRALVRAARAAVPVTMGNVGLDYLLGRFAEGADRDRIERHHTWFGSLSFERQRKVLSPRVLAAVGEADPFESARARLRGKRFRDGLSELLYTDFTMYLQDDLLTKVDRATMLASLESRAPFLDHELAEYVAALPSSLKIRGLTTKAVLRRALRSRLPAEVLSRRKRGFNIPFSRWLLHGLGGSLRERFSEERVRARGLLDPAGVASLLDEHLSRRADHRKPIFTLLALDLWCDRTYGDGAPVPLAAGDAGR